MKRRVATRRCILSVSCGLAAAFAFESGAQDITWAVVHIHEGEQLMPVIDGRVMLSDDTVAHESDVVIKRYVVDQEKARALRSARAPRSYGAAGSVANPGFEFATTRVWPNRDLTYAIDAAFSDAQKERIEAAIWEWNLGMPYVFISTGSTTGAKPMVVFRPLAQGCKATLGKPGKKDEQAYVWLSGTCDKQSVLHEMGHVIGMRHEHQRSNRDQNITVRQDTLDYIKANHYASYDYVIKNLAPTRSNLGDPFDYDYRSVMQYGSYPRNNFELAKDLMARRLPLFTRKDGSEIERPDVGLTNKDIQRAEMIFNLRSWAVF